MGRRLLIYDEAIIGKELYRRKEVKEYSWAELISLSKYIRHELGYGDAKLKTAIKDILGRDTSFVYVRMRGFIGKIVKNSRKPYIKTGSVFITQEELLKIRNIKNFKWQKITLSFLFLSKRLNSRGYVKVKDWGDVKSSSCISHLKTSDIEAVVNYLYNQKDMIRVVENSDYDPSHELLFRENSNHVVFEIGTEKDARNLGNLYKEWCGGELSWCKECGKEFTKNGKTHSYCQTCSKEKELIRYKKYRA